MYRCYATCTVLMKCNLIHTCPDLSAKNIPTSPDINTCVIAFYLCVFRCHACGSSTPNLSVVGCRDIHPVYTTYPHRKLLSFNNVV